jgi:hypothetical protein
VSSANMLRERHYYCNNLSSIRVDVSVAVKIEDDC